MIFLNESKELRQNLNRTDIVLFTEVSATVQVLPLFVVKLRFFPKVSRMNAIRQD